MPDLLTPLLASLQERAADIERSPQIGREEIQLLARECGELRAELEAARKWQELPGDVIAHIRKLGPVEWGAIGPKTDEEHLDDFRRTLTITRDSHGVTEEQTSLHGVYLRGTETVLCHTGNSPNGGSTALIIAGLWNGFHDSGRVEGIQSRPTIPMESAPWLRRADAGKAGGRYGGLMPNPTAAAQRAAQAILQGNSVTCGHCDTVTPEGHIRMLHYKPCESNIEVAAIIDAAIRPLLEALEEISAVLGQGKCLTNQCEGCAWESNHASRVAKAALTTAKGEE